MHPRFLAPLLFASSIAFARPCAPLLLNGPVRVNESLARERTIAIENFWGEKFAQRGWPFTPIGLCVVEKSQDLGGGFVYLSSRTPVYYISSKCILLGTKFYARLGIAPATDAFLTFTLAHEAGHRVQHLRGKLRGMDPHLADDQADCLAGVFFRFLWKEGAIEAAHMTDVKRRLGPDGPLLAGRKGWFMRGFHDGLRGCEKIPPL